MFSFKSILFELTQEVLLAHFDFSFGCLSVGTCPTNPLRWYRAPKSLELPLTQTHPSCYVEDIVVNPTKFHSERTAIFTRKFGVHSLDTLQSHHVPIGLLCYRTVQNSTDV